MMRPRSLRQRKKVLALASVALALQILLPLARSHTSTDTATQTTLRERASVQPTAAHLQQLAKDVPDRPPRTLLLYVFSNNDREYLHNFAFFVAFGMKGDNVDYVVIIQKTEDMSLADKKTLRKTLAKLPEQTTVLIHANECYDTGAVGWALKQPEVASKLDDCTYFIVLNSSVRGPFLPPYFPDKRNWHTLLVRRLGGVTNVRLVGPAISCMDHWSERRHSFKKSPHVQTWLFAMDRPGLNLALSDGRPFKCHLDREDAIWDGELGLSRVMLDAGYNIDCLLERYQGVDWRLVQNDAYCNDKRNPTGENQFFGTTLSLYATIFVKYKYSHDIVGRSSATNDARLISVWMYEGLQGLI